MNCGLPKLESTDLHVWEVNIEENTLPAQYGTVLSTEELEKADRFRFDIDRNMFITGRLALRTLLGLYLDINPANIHFEYNDQGKPLFPNHKKVRFNLSNSAGKIAIGMCLHEEIGIDIEYNKRFVEVENVANSFFSTQEIESLNKVSKEKKLSHFYHCWTRKEAYIKARGGGLSIALDKFSVDINPHSESKTLSLETNNETIKKWSVIPFTFGTDFTGAICTQERALDIHYFSFDLLFTSRSLIKENR